MKKIIIPLIAFSLMLALLLGCGPKTETARMYVSYVDSRGFAGHIDGIGTVFVEYSDADKKIDVCDTVEIRFSEEALTAEIGSVTAITGNPFIYEWMITFPEKVTVSDPSTGGSVLG